MYQTLCMIFLSAILNFHPVEAKHKDVMHHKNHTKVEKIIQTKKLTKWISLGLHRITGYTGGDPSQGTGLYTASGTRARYGIVAVDRHVIPLGSILYIPGIGRVRAEDTGGAVHGAHIDLCFGIGGYAKQLANAWGTKMRVIYILKNESTS